MLKSGLNNRARYTQSNEYWSHLESRLVKLSRHVTFNTSPRPPRLRHDHQQNYDYLKQAIQTEHLKGLILEFLEAHHKVTLDYR